MQKNPEHAKYVAFNLGNVYKMYVISSAMFLFDVLVHKLKKVSQLGFENLNKCKACDTVEIFCFHTL